MIINPVELYRLAGEQLLAGKPVEIPISGGSMLPTLKPGKDRVRISRCNRYRRGDIVLAKAETPGGERVVLHRVVAINGERFTLMGDNNLQQQESCSKSQILGKVTDIISEGPMGRLGTSGKLGSLSPLWLLSRLRRSAYRLKTNFSDNPGWLSSVLIALCGTLSVTASLLFVACTKYIVDLAIHTPEASLKIPVCVMIAILIAQLLINTLSKRLSASATVKFSNRLRSRLFEHLLRARFYGKEKFHSGEAVNRLTSDVATLSSLYASTLPSSFSSLLLLIVAFAYLASLSGSIAIAIAAIMPVALILSKMFGKVSRRLTQTIRERESALYSNLQESLQHRLLFSMLQYTAGAARHFAALQQSFYAATMRRSDISIFAGGMVTLGFMAGYTVAFIWCANGLRSGAVSFGVMTAFLQLVAMVQRPVVDLARKVPLFMQADVAKSRIGEILALPVEEMKQSAPLPGKVGVRFSNVSFRYPDSDKEILHDFSFVFKPGTITPVMGETGAGKSTLLLLMLGVLKPQSGSIELYNDPKDPESQISGISCSEQTRSNFAYVPQGNSLLSGTVRSNLLVADPEASEQQLLEALHAAAADFVMQLPEGLDTPCGERGQGFSEGQAQRIAIARGLLRKGGVIVLDEPTSALDNTTAQELLQRLRKFAADKTIIMVTHQDKLLKAMQQSAGIVRL